MSSQLTASVQTQNSAPRAGARGWLGLATLVLPVVLISVDMTVLGFAVPHLSEDLAPTSGQLLWIVDIYAFMLAGLLITMGSLGDRIGRRRLLMIGTAGFGLASAFAAFSISAEMLIAARALLGLAGATLMPSTLSLIRNLFPDSRQRTLAIAIWASAFSAGAALGPIIGGILLEHFFWGSVFLINLPVVALILVAMPFLVTESRDPNPGRLDLMSVLLSLTGMISAVFGVKKLAEGRVEVLPIAALAVGVALLVIFVRRQRTLDHPLLDLELFSRRRFRAGVSANFMLVFAMVGSMFFLPQLLQLGYGMSPLQASVALVPGLVISVIASFIVIPIARATSLRTVIVGGILIAASGYAVLMLTPVETGWGFVMVSFFLIGLGVGLAETMTNDAVLSSAPPHRAGAASAVSETSYELGGALGVAVLGSVLASGYRGGIEHVDGVPAGTMDAASQTLGAAHAASEQLGGVAGDALMDAAREAFVSSVHLTSGIAVAIVVAAAVMVFLMLRGDSEPGADKA
ncbi:MFS transporter [Nesterenkonia xinjiangensis]|uniref:DHA2 family multidrug resistance protein-like MFS transporter n=1 Tax=Nesterenkonia xinjiangensis TaxID=225327 RepID=A0A7Z0GKF9_9MICC|nr:MFS transporter [Nesterenkonia xinjiangensis]NYJ77605.1 DHA2 family multidrug resistance protein-like MFS transporter [Nesterenkonia xinjiangensis]